MLQFTQYTVIKLLSVFGLMSIVVEINITWKYLIQSNH